MNTAVLIPAYRPGRALLDLVHALDGRGLGEIVIVDDGSGPSFREIFERAAALPRVHVLRHETNRGKGAALKTGIVFVRDSLPEATGIVTADADGQHDPDDIERVAAELQRKPNWLVLGARGFKGEVPLRSRVGNALSRWVVRLVVGQNLRDTQTGLRGIPRVMWGPLVEIEGNGYEFELEMLIAGRRLTVPVQEVPIRTIYQGGNAASHFNPLVDSMRIYFVLLRFASVSVMTAAIDNVVFYLAYRRTGHILASQALGRSVAVSFNYWMVRRSVFHSRQWNLVVLPQYLMLVLASGAASYGGILLLSHRGLNPVPAKLAVETVLFFGNFAVQRLLIFKPRADGPAKPAAKVLWISWLVFLMLAAVIGIEAYGFVTHSPLAPYLWFPSGLRRLIRYSCLFVEAGLPMLLIAPWLFTGVTVSLLAAGTAISAPAGLAATGLFLLASWTAGSRLVRGAPAACALLLGSAIYIFLMTLTARLPVHYPIVWAVLLAAPILMDARRTWQGLTALAGRIRRAQLPTAGERAAFALLVFVIGMHWLVALKPETGADALAMHLAVPTDIAAHHGMTYEPGRFLWSVMPMGADWAYSITYLLGGEPAPRLLNFAMLLVILALLYEAVRRFAPPAASFLLLAVFAATPMVQLVTGSLFVENVLAAMVLGALVALWRYAASGEARFLCLAAILGGSAIGVKLAALATVAIALPFAVAAARRHRLRLGAGALALGLFLAAALPTYAIAWRKTGDPLFPFLNQTFRTPLLDRSVVLRDYRYHDPITWHIPFDLTFRTSHYYEGRDGSFGFQYLLLIPAALLVLAAVRRFDTVSATVVALGGMAAVMLSQPNLRYLYSLLPFLLVPAAALLGWLRMNQRWLYRVLLAFLAVCLPLDIYLMPASGWYQLDFYSQAVFVPHGRERYLRTDVCNRDVARYFARMHPGEAVFSTDDCDLADLGAALYVANWHQYHIWHSIDQARDRGDVLRLFEQWKIHYVIGQTPSDALPQFPALRDVVDHCLVREYQNHWSYLARVDTCK